MADATTVVSGGTYQWQIAGVSMLSTSFNSSICSPEFRVAGRSWHLRLYWGGESRPADEPTQKTFVSLFLEMIAGEPAEAEFSFVVAAPAEITTFATAVRRFLPDSNSS
jgi:hypothetical protein